MNQHPLVHSLSGPTPMTTPIPFWMEGNSSTDFGLVNHLQQFQFSRVLKKHPFFFTFFFQTHFTNLPTPF
jgi:hypothetical protein